MFMAVLKTFRLPVRAMVLVLLCMGVANCIYNAGLI